MGQPQFYRDTWVEINLDHMSENIRVMKEHLSKDVELIAVVKANGYGHGDYQTGKTALAAGASKLAVSLLDEALSLRKQGITAPIMMLGVSRPEDAHLAATHQITLSVFQEDWLKKAQQFLDKDDRLHLQMKLDSGMGRIGIRDPEEIMKMEQIIERDERFILDGAYTHFATADEENLTYFKEQVVRFDFLLSHFKNRPKMIHCGNSAAALRFSETHMNAARLGIAMYGLSPSLVTEKEQTLVLKETFSLHTKLIHVKKIRAGEKVSYGATYEALEEEWIGTIPIGYADGWLRVLSGQEVIIDGVRAPIVGKICMDLCMVRLPKYSPVGTKVTLIGKQNGGEISINEIAEKMGTINYEVPCVISSRVPRVYQKNGKILTTNNPVLK